MPFQAWVLVAYADADVGRGLNTFQRRRRASSIGCWMDIGLAALLDAEIRWITYCKRRPFTKAHFHASCERTGEMRGEKWSCREKGSDDDTIYRDRVLKSAKSPKRTSLVTLAPQIYMYIYIYNMDVYTYSCNPRDSSRHEYPQRIS